MKRKEFIRQLKKEGCILLRKGANHDIYFNPVNGNK
jgi:predicted RNA binding protein YcfA (HicA-like mRNA interferase family)